MTTTLIPNPRKLSTEPRRSDKVFRGVVTGGGLSSLVILGLITIFLAYRGFEIFQQEGIGFITNSEWGITVDESGNIVESTFGLAAMLVGTILCSLVAVVIALPISVLSALYLNFYAPGWLKKILVAVIDLMAAFPSILFGVWGFLVLMPSVEYWARLLNRHLSFVPAFEVFPPYFTRSPFVAGVVLAMMIIPIITSVSREIFAQAPLDRIQAAYALGATRWAMIKAVVIPHGRSGVVGGAMCCGIVSTATKLTVILS